MREQKEKERNGENRRQELSVEILGARLLRFLRIFEERSASAAGCPRAFQQMLIVMYAFAHEREDNAVRVALTDIEHF